MGTKMVCPNCDQLREGLDRAYIVEYGMCSECLESCRWDDEGGK